MSALIVTLGTEPQVVTTTLDLLLQQKEKITQVVVLHTVSPRTNIADAIQKLQTEFSQFPYGDNLDFKFCPLTDEHGVYLEDVKTFADTKSAFRVFYHQVQIAKRAGQKLHLCIAGGRKNLAIFGMVAAQMLFDEDDCLWHLYSDGTFLEKKRLHPKPGDDTHLIPIPVILWSQVSPVFTDLGEIEDPFQAIARIRELHISEKIDAARTFVLGSLSPAERRVVQSLVRDGLSDQELAKALHLSPRTIEQHLRSAYTKAAAHWDIASVNRTQLIALLNLYYSTKIGETPHDK